VLDGIAHSALKPSRDPATDSHNQGWMQPPVPLRALRQVKIGARMFKQCRWLNEPDRWALAPEGLAVTTNRATDFWRETHYGFIRDSGHFFGCEVPSSFTASLRIKARYESLYDQAGIMVRIDAENWIMAGIELSTARRC